MSTSSNNVLVLNYDTIEAWKDWKAIRAKRNASLMPREWDNAVDVSGKAFVNAARNGTYEPKLLTQLTLERVLFMRGLKALDLYHLYQEMNAND